ncbi:MAG: hypothetical protein ACMXYG_01600 [Candidatus Woesearchaeota archaeon]
MNMQKNKNIRIFSIVTLIAIFLLISGCGSGPSTGLSSQYRTGTQGLELQFTTNSPPYIVYAEDGAFPVGVEIKNLGVYPGEGDGTLNAMLYYFGFDRDIIRGLTNEPVVFQELEAKTRYNPQGGFTVVSSEAEMDPAFFRDTRLDSYSANIQAVLCYPYKTFASIDVCVDPNPNRASSLDSCRPGLVSGGSQGAPIAVSSVESISQREKARFVVTIANVGGGTVIRDTELGRCSDVNLNREDMDKVLITNARLSNGIPLTCTPSGHISLINGRATIICMAEGLDENMPAFRTVLQMELSYGYKKSIERRIQIQGE